jgi:hypothetical protein
LTSRVARFTPSFTTCTAAQVAASAAVDRSRCLFR